MKSDDKDEIEAKTKALTEVSGKLAERVYAQKSAEGGQQPQADAGARAAAKVEARMTWSMPSSRKSRTSSTLRAGFA